MTYNEILTKIKNQVLETYPPNGINIVLPSITDYAIQLTSSDNELRTLNGQLLNEYDMSIINLKECESLLKSTYGINSNEPLIILKLEKLTKVAKEKDVQYEIYNPNTFEKLDLSICANTDIDIIMPIELEKEIEDLYRALKDRGYDLFDINDIFYTDICTPFEAKNGADILLNDRIIYFYEKIINYTECPNDCSYSSFSIETKGLSCKCKASNINIDSDNINIFRRHSYYLPDIEKIKYSGYKTMKCYKLVFNFKNFTKNAGSIISLIFFIVYVLFMIYYIMKDISTLKISISKYLFDEIEIKDDYSPMGTINPLLTFHGKVKRNKNNNINNQIQNSESKSFKNSFLNKSKKPKKIKKKEISVPPKRQRVQKTRINSAEKRKENENVKLIDLMKQRKKIGKMNKFHNIKNHKKIQIQTKNKKDFEVESLKSDKVRKRKTIIDYENEREQRIRRVRELIEFANRIKDNPSIFEENKNNSNSEKKSIESINEIQKKEEKGKDKKEDKISDYELNRLKFEEAIVLDNRSFCKIYWSLIKRNELFLITFVSWNDYNLFYIKIEKFIIIILTIMTLNCFLFPDKSIHNYFINGVKYNFGQQILPIFLSFIISYILEILLCFLTMTDRYIYEVKSLSKIEVNRNKVISVLRGMKMKLMAFYIGGTFFALFYWYVISAFCSVYINTQTIYIIDCVISFVIFLVVPFIIYFIIAVIRIISLKSVIHKKLKWLYKISNLLPIF